MPTNGSVHRKKGQNLNAFVHWFFAPHFICERRKKAQFIHLNFGLSAEEVLVAAVSTQILGPPLRAPHSRVVSKQLYEYRKLTLF